MRATILFSAVSDVTIRFPEYITGLREFLAQSGCPVGAPEAVHLLADHVAQDLAFKEDLTSMFRVICAAEPGVSYLELLGMLLVAAQGVEAMAAAAETPAGEQTASRLFNAVVEMRRSINIPAGTPGAEEPAEQSVPPPDNAFSFEEAPQPLPPATPRSAAMGPGGGMHERLARALALAADADTFGSQTELREAQNFHLPVDTQLAAAPEPQTCVAPQTSTETAKQPAIVATPAPPVTSVDEPELLSALVPPPPNPNRRTWAVGVCGLALGLLLGVLGERYAVTRSREDAGSAAVPASQANTLSSTAPAVHSPYGLRHPVPRRSADLPVPILPAADESVAPAPLIPVPVDPQPVRAEATSPAPRPRSEAGNASSSTGSRGLASANVPPPALPRPIRLNTADATAADTRLITGRGPGRVTLGSAGIMAANLVSSPAPVYPAQASAAQVQGEVIVEAIVGRNGQVIDTRVVSGPPMLREAARSAVERWRYRPYQVDGTPTEIATIARVDFHLDAD